MLKHTNTCICIFLSIISLIEMPRVRTSTAHIYIHPHAYTQDFLSCTPIKISPHIYAPCVNEHTHMHTRAHMHMPRPVCSYTLTCTHTHVQCSRVFSYMRPSHSHARTHIRIIHTCTYTHMHMLNVFPHRNAPCAHKHTRACIF